MDYKSYKELKGYQWAKDVISGKFKANKYVILECSRYINRLEKIQYQDDFKFYFDIDEANIVYGLTSLINYSTGFYANEPVFNHLAGFQCFVIENVFCWFSKEKDENGLTTKMVEEVYLEVGRKSGKMICHLI